MMPPALVLAGSRGPDDSVAQAAGVSAKALAEVAGQTMLARVVAALRAAGVTRILVSASDPAVAEAARALGTEPIAAAAGPSASVAAAFAETGAPLIVTTADHALLEAAWVTHLVEQAPADCDVAVMLAERAVIEAAQPGSRRTYLRMADGDWSGCNLFLLATPAATRALVLWQEVEADRKRPWRIARRLGARALLRYLLHRLTLGQAFDRLGEMAGARAAAVASPFGLAAVDVDTADDLATVRAIAAR